MRTCKKCGEVKELEKFPIIGRRTVEKPYRMYTCRLCHNKAVRDGFTPEKHKRYRNNRDINKIRSHVRKWRKNHRAHLYQYDKKRKNEKIKIEDGIFITRNALKERKRREKLVDAIVKKDLKDRGFHKEDITPELIECKRAHIKLKRELKNER